MTVFGYRPGASLAHRLDVRFKLLFLIVISLVTLNGRPAGLAVLTVLALTAVCLARLPLAAAAREMKILGWLLLLVFVARALSTPGEPVFEILSLAPTLPGLLDGLLICWRLVLVVLFGFVLIATSRSTDLKAAVIWALKPFPSLPGPRLGTMMGLVVRFIPMIMEQARETTDAQKARCVDNRRNPIYRLVKLVVPLVRRIFEDADKLTLAMEARCYSDDRNGPKLKARPLSWWTALVVIGLCAVAWRL
jgi:energy-coupling factor transporter transmembrane protein EcfT